MSKIPKNTDRDVAKKVESLDTTVKTLVTVVGNLTNTVDTLARSTAEGFANTATKDDLKNLEEKMDEKINNLDEKLSAKIDNLQNRQDIYAGLDRKVETLDKRLTKIERKVGA